MVSDQSFLSHLGSVPSHLRLPFRRRLHLAPLAIHNSVSFVALCFVFAPCSVLALSEPGLVLLQLTLGS